MKIKINKMITTMVLDNFFEFIVGTKFNLLSYRKIVQIDKYIKSLDQNCLTFYIINYLHINLILITTEINLDLVLKYISYVSRLSELHALDHSRDLRIFDDRKFRQEQQMALVERDFDKLPQEAKQQLIDADYTLCKKNYLLY